MLSGRDHQGTRRENPRKGHLEASPFEGQSEEDLQRRLRWRSNHLMWELGFNRLNKHGTMATEVMKRCYCALKQDPCIGKTEATQIVPSRLQEGKRMIAHKEVRIEGMFPHEGRNPYSFQDMVLKIAIILGGLQSVRLNALCTLSPCNPSTVL